MRFPPQEGLLARGLAHFTRFRVQTQTRHFVLSSIRVTQSYCNHCPKRPVSRSRAS